MRLLPLTVLAIIAAAGEAAADPATLTLRNGRVLYGASTVSIDGETIEVGDRRVICAGRFAPPGDQQRVALNLGCSDGLVGAAILVRDGRTGGHARVFFSNGTVGTLAFGGGSGLF